MIYTEPLEHRVPAQPAERPAIGPGRRAGDLPAATRPHYQYRAADNPRFAAALAARLHPKGVAALGGIDVCDVTLPTRRTPAS